MSYKDISDMGFKLKKQELIGKFDGNEVGFYEHCIIVKAQRVKFIKSHHKAQVVLDYGYSRRMYVGVCSQKC